MKCNRWTWKIELRVEFQYSAWMTGKMIQKIQRILFFINIPLFFIHFTWAVNISTFIIISTYFLLIRIMLHDAVWEFFLFTLNIQKNIDLHNKITYLYVFSPKIIDNSTMLNVLPIFSISVESIKFLYVLKLQQWGRLWLTLITNDDSKWLTMK